MTLTSKYPRYSTDDLPKVAEEVVVAFFGKDQARAERAILEYAHAYFLEKTREMERTRDLNAVPHLF